VIEFYVIKSEIANVLIFYIKNVLNVLQNTSCETKLMPVVRITVMQVMMELEEKEGTMFFKN
jgi:hypothetical protein